MGSAATARRCSACGAPSSAFNVRCPRCGEVLGSATGRTVELTASEEAAGPAAGIDPLAATLPIEGAAAAAGVRPGAMLARFEVIERLGEGAMGEVVRGRDPALGREVAIKVLRRSARSRAGGVRPGRACCARRRRWRGSSTPTW